MTNNIENTDVLIHRNRDTLPLTGFAPDEYFGILTVKMAKTKLVKIPTFLLFTIDKTGSMQEMASKNSSKMDYVIQTFVSMMNYLSTLDTEIYIQVNSFNTVVDVTIPKVKISTDNVNELTQIIKTLRCDGSTNIGLALTTANTVLESYKNEFEDHQIGHIFMTDGEPTAGVCSVEKLVENVNENFYNTFVGFGFHHNVDLLNKCGEKNNAEYQFVDNMENTALIYGETIHKFIYPALKNVDFCVEGGTIYDWSTNSWKASIKESIIISEIEKIYHIRTTNPETVSVLIYGEQCSNKDSDTGNDFNQTYRILDVGYSLPDLLDSQTNLPQLNEDLTKYAFRQRVQELLFRAKQGFSDDFGKNEYKNNLKIMFRTIRKYMRTTDGLEDGLLKLLCDDISQIYNTFNTGYGIMFATARANSQGRQRTYNTNSSYDTDIGNPEFSRQNALVRSPSLSPPVLMRTNTNSFHNIDEMTQNYYNNEEISIIPNSYSEADDINDETFYKYDELGFITSSSMDPDNDTEFVMEDEIDNYASEDMNTTCFATPGLLDTMRSMSRI